MATPSFVPFSVVVVSGRLEDLSSVKLIIKSSPLPSGEGWPENIPILRLRSDGRYRREADRFFRFWGRAEISSGLQSYLRNPSFVDGQNGKSDDFPHPLGGLKNKGPEVFGSYPQSVDKLSSGLMPYAV